MRLAVAAILYCMTAASYAASSSAPVSVVPASSTDLLTMSVSNLGSLLQTDECDDGALLAADDTLQAPAYEPLPQLALNAPSASSRSKAAAASEAKAKKSAEPAAVATPAASTATTATATPTTVAAASAAHAVPAATAAPAAAPAPMPAPTPTWEIAITDKTLNAALARWAAQAGWQLVWEIPIDYAVETRTTVPGSFVEAVTLVTNSMSTAEIPLKAIFYDGNKVLRIVPKGAE